MMLFLRSVSFYIGQIVCTILIAPIGIIAFPLDFKKRYYLISQWAVFNLWWLKICCNIRYKVEGRRNIPDEPCIVMCKHQSAFETFALYYYLKNCFFVHKRELFLIPIFGQYLLKSNMVSINRDGGTKAMRQMLQNVKLKLNTGSSIVIFPEGTRKLPGSKPDYKTGFIGIYNHTKRKILPVALNSGLCWPKQSWILKSGIITIKFLPTIKNGLDKKVILNEVQNRIETASSLLLNN